MNKRVFLAGVAATALSVAVGQVWAQGAPKGRVVLTVSGAIGKTNVGNTYQLDMAMVDALPQHTFGPLESQREVIEVGRHALLKRGDLHGRHADQREQEQHDHGDVQRGTALDCRPGE